ncbi:MAG: hypothetical protein ACTHOF_02110 [Flavisolibacter sp.]
MLVLAASNDWLFVFPTEEGPLVTAISRLQKLILAALFLKVLGPKALLPVAVGIRVTRKRIAIAVFSIFGVFRNNDGWLFVLLTKEASLPTAVNGYAKSNTGCIIS